VRGRVSLSGSPFAKVHHAAIMLVVSASTVVLAFFMLPGFSRNIIPWLLASIQTLSFIRTLWSSVLSIFRSFVYVHEYFPIRITRKPLLDSSQSVASEAIGLFSLFPFHLSESILTGLQACV
jgi:hypothetical protein